jgi:hypothetical protein
VTRYTELVHLCDGTLTLAKKRIVFIIKVDMRQPTHNMEFEQMSSRARRVRTMLHKSSISSPSSKSFAVTLATSRETIGHSQMQVSVGCGNCLSEGLPPPQTRLASLTNWNHRHATPHYPKAPDLDLNVYGTVVSVRWKLIVLGGMY